MFASQILNVVAFFCCWGIDQEEDCTSVFLSEVLGRDEVRQCSLSVAIKQSNEASSVLR